jgi:hypothetical protein
VDTQLIWLGDNENGVYIAPHSKKMLSIVNAQAQLIDIDIDMICNIREAEYITLLADGDVEPFNINNALNPYFRDLKVDYQLYSHTDGKFWATNGRYVGYKNPLITSDLWVFCEPKTIRTAEKLLKGYQQETTVSYFGNPLKFYK